jgi:hypothetical protein
MLAAGEKINPARLKRVGDAFNSYDKARQEYEDRGATRAQAGIQAAIDYPELHNEWRAAKGRAHSAQRSSRNR